MALALQPMVAMKTTAILLGCCLAAACTGDDEAGMSSDAATFDADPTAPDADPTRPDADPNRPDATVRSFANEIITNDCAPNDGPALRIHLTDDTIDAECRGQGFGRSIELLIYTRSITAPQTITFSETNFAGGGTECLGGAAPCLFTQEGEVHFETYVPDVGASGTWTLDFNGNVQTGTFEVDWCDPATPLFCG